MLFCLDSGRFLENQFLPTTVFRYSIVYIFSGMFTSNITKYCKQALGRKFEHMSESVKLSTLKVLSKEK
jgi:hypothetical protein